MVNIDINIPVDRRTAIAAGAGLVAVVGGLAYCALRPSVKVICAESIVPAMRAVGDKSPPHLTAGSGLVSSPPGHLVRALRHRGGDPVDCPCRRQEPPVRCAT